jgi:succinyl-CoA synthetase beta subunit
LNRTGQQYVFQGEIKVARTHPHLIFTEEIDPSVGLQGFQARRIAFNLGLSVQRNGKIHRLLYNAYIGSDASMFEINPVLKHLIIKLWL